MPSIPYEKTPTSNAPWDAGMAKKDLKEGEAASYYRKEFAWVDPEGDPTTKAAYKFPHHQVSSDGTVGDANIKACQSAIGVLNGGMGGSQIPAGDHQGVYDHLAKHLKDAGLDVPDLKRSAPAPQINRRTITTPTQQFRAVQNADGSHTISGHAALYNSLSNPLPDWNNYGRTMYREVLAPGCFNAAMAAPDLDVTCNWNHDDQFILGRTSSGTLNLSLDDQGLAFDCTLPDTSYARDLSVLMQRGDLNQCSFSFDIDPANIDTTTVDGESIQTINQVSNLYDVCVCTRGAYSQPSASYRTLDDSDIERVVSKVLDAKEKATINSQVNDRKALDGIERLKLELELLKLQ